MSADRITLPPRELFISAEEHFGTWAHEASHSTGHPKRLNRDSIAEAAPFGSSVYAGEELIAELSAAYLCAEAGSRRRSSTTKRPILRAGYPN
jgi:antirestriction protein ArdC